MIHHSNREARTGHEEKTAEKKIRYTSPKHSLADGLPSKKQWEKGSTYELDSVSYRTSTTLVANDCS